MNDIHRQRTAVDVVLVIGVIVVGVAWGIHLWDIRPPTVSRQEFLRLAGASVVIYGLIVYSATRIWKRSRGDFNL